MARSMGTPLLVQDKDPTDAKDLIFRRKEIGGVRLLPFCWYAKEGLRRPSRQPPRCLVSGSSNVSTRWGDERGNATGGINSAMYGRIKENSNTYIVKLTIKLIFKRRIATI